MTYLITQTLNGLFSAALLFLIASGLTLVFGVMRIVNIAPGSFFMLGVYVAHTMVSRTRSVLLGGLGAVLVVAAIGPVMERVFLRRFTARPLAQMTMTMGFALLLRDLAFMIWGGDPFTLPVPAIEHDIDVAFAFAEQVTVLYQGRVLAEGHRMAIAADRRVQEVYLGVNS